MNTIFYTAALPVVVLSRRQRHSGSDRKATLFRIRPVKEINPKLLEENYIHCINSPILANSI